MGKLKELYIYGCGGVGRELAERFITGNKVKLCGFIDDNPEIKECMGLASSTLDAILKTKKSEEIQVVISFGEPFIREKVARRLQERGIEEVTADISAHCNPSLSRIGKGCVLHTGSYISVNTKIGKCCLVNKDVIVGHDSKIGDYVVLSPRVSMGGDVTIGDRTFIGSGATLRNDIHIGKNVIIGMGAVVVSDIEDNVVAFGNPARVVRKNVTGRVFRKTSEADLRDNSLSENHDKR